MNWGVSFWFSFRKEENIRGGGGPAEEAVERMINSRGEDGANGQKTVVEKMTTSMPQKKRRREG